MDREIIQEVEKCMKEKFEQAAISSWSFERLVDKKYGRLGCFVKKLLPQIPIPSGKKRIDVFNRLKEIVDENDFLELIDGKDGMFLTVTDEMAMKVLKEKAYTYEEEKRKEFLKFFWGDNELVGVSL